MRSGRLKRTPPFSCKTKDDNFFTQELELSTKRYGTKKLAKHVVFSLYSILLFFFAFVMQLSSKIKSAQFLFTKKIKC